MPSSVRVFIAPEPVDLRASYYRLASLVRGHLGADPQDGHLYVFVNKQRNLTKVLFWDRSGFCLLCKRLEAGRFQLPKTLPDGALRIEVDANALTLFLEGIDLAQARRRPSYEPPPLKPRGARRNP